ncbi:uncharacterized protein [Procambarus clarkii]|uniref:uncharacterized protein n=1 Tax=Procambarus clarkii TaxID=6728 RepID=UPI001E677778|nr:uncharacterized protein LOC123754360 [Procambarus clarkii]
MKLSKMNQTVPDSARRRVCILGIVSMVMAAVQVVALVVKLSFVVAPQHRDIQVLAMCGGMAATIAAYLLLTTRLLFLFYKMRYEETAGPEWLWWLATMALVMFNAMLVVWFILLEDVTQVVVACLATLAYIVFFKFAKDDIMTLRQHHTTKSSEETT